MRDFDFDVMQKKRIARGAAHMKRGSKSKQCFLPSDHLTPAEWRRRNGPVSTYKLDAPMSWEAFKAMPVDIQRQYVNNLRNLYQATDAMFGQMFFVSAAHFYRHRVDVLGITDSMTVLKGKENRERRDAMWSAFCNGVVGGNSEQEVKEETSVDEDPEVEEVLNGFKDWSESILPVEVKLEKTLSLDELTAVFTGKFDPETFLHWLTRLPVPEANVRIKVEVTRV